MGFEKTDLKHFKKYCYKTYDDKEARLIHAEASKRLDNLTSEFSPVNHPSILWHLHKNLLPTISIYQTFKEFFIDSQKALDATSEVLIIACEKKRKMNQFISRLPFGYGLFKDFCQSTINKQYPKENFQIEWIKYDHKEIHFNFNRCIYVDVTRELGCPELCPLFCANDDITLSGYSPKIIFYRTMTIGRGDNACDFHFINAKHHTDSDTMI